MNLPSNGNSNFQLKLTIVGNAVCGKVRILPYQYKIRLNTNHSTKSSPVVTYALGKFTEVNATFGTFPSQLNSNRCDDCRLNRTLFLLFMIPT
jgi:hypothetical protein